ncbi:hypothetical protein ACFWA9_37730 [Kitasatospora sp. NPDC059973]|uniref:hypothetical protein n=1 Tax=Kitasatospora sp. NPDC059973 TaxID=3347020 RepID=UPI0036C81D12
MSGIQRVTVTLPEELPEEISADRAERGLERLLPDHVVVAGSLTFQPFPVAALTPLSHTNSDPVSGRSRISEHPAR